MRTSGNLATTAVVGSFYIIGILLSTFGSVYAAYWSFLIRRKLVTPTFRRQALIVGAISLYGGISVVFFYAIYFFAPDLPAAFMPALEHLQVFLYGILPAIGLAWADSSIRVGRRLDPRLRDSFRWSMTRWVLWPLMIASNVAFFVGSGLTTTYDTLAKVALVSALILLGISVVVVSRTARRAADRSYRKSLEWFAAFIAFYLIYNAGFISLLLVFPAGNLLVYTPVDFTWGVIANLGVVPLLFFCMYRCSRSLVPLNRISPTDSK
jgi:hypothetical protein